MAIGDVASSVATSLSLSLAADRAREAADSALRTRDLRIADGGGHHDEPLPDPSSEQSQPVTGDFQSREDNDAALLRILAQRLSQAEELIAQQQAAIGDIPPEREDDEGDIVDPETLAGGGAEARSGTETDADGGEATEDVEGDADDIPPGGGLGEDDDHPEDDDTGDDDTGDAGFISTSEASSRLQGEIAYQAAQAIASGQERDAEINPANSTQGIDHANNPVSIDLSA